MRDPPWVPVKMSPWGPTGATKDVCNIAAMLSVDLRVPPSSLPHTVKNPDSCGGVIVRAVDLPRPDGHRRPRRASMRVLAAAMLFCLAATVMAGGLAGASPGARAVRRLCTSLFGVFFVIVVENLVVR